jgi:Cu/Ag efflux protein CusF
MMTNIGERLDRGCLVMLKAAKVAFLVSVSCCLSDLWAESATNGASCAQADQHESFPVWGTPPIHKTTPHLTTGVVEAVDTENGTITLDHGSGQAMGFPILIKARYIVADRELLKDFVVGQKVTVSLRKQVADYVVTGLVPAK